jgi:hypothetical protein
MSVGVCVKLLLRMYRPFSFTFLISNVSIMNVYVMKFIIPHLNVFVSQFLVVKVTSSRCSARRSHWEIVVACSTNIVTCVRSVSVRIWGHYKLVLE